jgi:hypothetical protein
MEKYERHINTIFRQIPDIAYFPTFVFDFPASIYLTDRGGTVEINFTVEFFKISWTMTIAGIPLKRTLLAAYV